jgi:hypothetical protein
MNSDFKSRFCLLRILGLFRQHVCAVISPRWDMRRGAFCSNCWRCNFELIPRALHFVLHLNVQKDVESPKHRENRPESRITFGEE